MPERQRAQQQSGYNFIANPQHHGGIKHIVRKGYCRALGNNIAAHQAQVHPRVTLSHPITHSRNTTSKLRNTTDFFYCFFNRCRIGLVGLMRRQHIVVGRHNRDISFGHTTQIRLVFGPTGREAVRQVATRQHTTVRPLTAGPVYFCQVRFAGVFAALDYALGNFSDLVVHK